ncbi:cation:proton antiporter [Caulobacter rhizosphaerae]|jgi:NhaP-type Na+/H+ or K+/H+ antiporter|uniref:NhaP-type Na+/H+ or K+/H+ antiporter n=1 Tax=Caulobacter rhizosphaerae TaxID=2010972 RepID=A0ABU1N491_9CAUL|nr:cation:proton antiporter [Caulobacter rhizosphaerae]MDR6533254.1 NhaP-type Na+/H+ or K+/H+ antiporter [Caulobacter rhizosphaerae]GGL08483.1 cation transporter [Caulobacter rhizosphaerae]
MFDSYLLFLLGLGVVVLLIAWLPMALSRLPLSVAILCVLIGVVVFHGGVLPFRSDPLRFSTLTERLTEIVVIVSLMGAGLKIDRRIGWRRWESSWRLIAVTMPLSILAVTLMGVHGLGLPLAAALLLGGALAPTDPVLASDVQVGPPRSGEDGEARFALTSEAGLNDGFAFPFVHLAVGLGLAGGVVSAPLLTHWLAVDVLWRVAAGAGVGWAVGRALGWATFKAPHARISGTGDGLVALGATLVAYGVAEAAHGYGFLAVFIAALALRETERDHAFHEAMHDFAEQVERLLMMLVLVLLGGAVAGGLLDSLTWKEVAFGLALVFVVRPLAGWIGLTGAPHSKRERAVVAFFGIRGLGSFYYLAYGLNHGDFHRWDRLWAITGFVVLCSILVHGVTATPLMTRIDAWRRREILHEDETQP